MREFFTFWRFLNSRTTDNQELAEVGRMYGAHLLDYLWRSEVYPEATTRAQVKQKLSQSRFTVVLSTGSDESPNLEQLTKQATLISDTLLLSHHQTEKFHSLDVRVWSDRNKPLSSDETLDRWADQIVSTPSGKVSPPTPSLYSLQTEIKSRIKSSNSVKIYGMHCSNMAELGRWILDAKQLLKAGLVWYLPNYSIETRSAHEGQVLQHVHLVERLQAVDYLISSRRAVDISGMDPIKSQLVRPVLQIELPFVEGVSLQDFSKITVEEFAAYSDFRDFLRQRFLDMDDAMSAVQSERELIKLGLQIKDQVRATRSEFKKVRRKRVVTVTGAIIGSVGAMLVAVHGPTLAAAIATIGAGGGVWGIIHAATENSTRHLQEDKWYYVWVLTRKTNNYIL